MAIDVGGLEQQNSPKQHSAQIAGHRVTWWSSAPAQPAPVVLCIHGVAASSHIWKGMARHLSQMELLAVDIPGHGGSEPIARASPASIALWAGRFLDYLGKRSVHAVVGHSMGGSIGLEMALGQPHRLGLLMLLNSGPQLPTWARLSLRAPGVARLLALPDTLPKLNSDTFARFYLQRIFGESQRVTDEIVKDYLGLAETPGFYGQMASAMAGFAAHRRRMTDLRRIRVPVSLVFGAKDPIFPLPMAERMARYLPHAALHRLPMCGHCPPEETPEVCADLLRELVGRSLRTPRTEATA